MGHHEGKSVTLFVNVENDRLSVVAGKEAHEKLM